MSAAICPKVRLGNNLMQLQQTCVLMENFSTKLFVVSRCFKRCLQNLIEAVL